MRVWSFILYVWFCLNFAIIIANEMRVLPVQQPQLLAANWWEVNFNMAKFAAVLSGSLAIGVVGWIFRQYTFASLAMVIWTAACIFIPIFTGWLTLLPDFLKHFLPPGFDSLYYLLISVNTVMFFMFIVQLLTQRSVET